MVQLSNNATSLIGSGIGAVGNVVGSAMSSAISASQARRQAEYAAKLNWKYAKKNARYMPTYQREGYERAGYNPMLLANGGLGSSENSWTSTQPIQAPDFGNVGSEAVNSALSIRQQRNNDIKTDSEVFLNNTQSITELFKQLNIDMDTQVKDLQRQLYQKDYDNYERKQIREDLRVATERQRMLNDYELGVKGNIIQSIMANNQGIIAGSTAKEQNANAEQVKLRTKWIKEHPFLYGFERAGTGFGAMLGAGIGAYATFRGGGKTKSAKPNFKTSVPYR